MIHGIGFDLCQISRIQNILDREGPDGSFFLHCFTAAERAEGRCRGNRADFYAARFAVKEAAAKAIGPGIIDLRRIESLHHPDGSPYISLTEELNSVLSKKGITSLHLSVSTEGDFAGAVVLADSEEPEVNEGKLRAF
ncbi:MAG: holo-ACP synthase [Oscillospiraceae bacterium]|nr:holo-ACP synthase [Oscillospiraceae bacterium]